eukprot:Platyproteum_vivax@DN11985_c0_g1_i1.p1
MLIGVVKAIPCLFLFFFVVSGGDIRSGFVSPGLNNNNLNARGAARKLLLRRNTANLLAQAQGSPVIAVIGSNALTSRMHKLQQKSSGTYPNVQVRQVPSSNVDPQYMKKLNPECIICSTDGVDQDSQNINFDDEAMHESGIRLLKLSIESAVQQARLRQFLLISALGAGESEDWIPQNSIEPLRAWLSAKTAQEQLLINSDLPYTILRIPSIDTADNEDDDDKVGVIFSEGPNVFGEITLTGVAKAVMNTITSRNTLNRKLVALSSDKVKQANPYARKYESFETPPFELFQPSGSWSA